MPVFPATQDAEAGELPEPRRRRLRWAKIAPLHSSLGNKSEIPSQKKKKKLYGRKLNFVKKDEMYRWVKVKQKESCEAYKENKHH